MLSDLLDRSIKSEATEKIENFPESKGNESQNKKFKFRLPEFRFSWTKFKAFFSRENVLALQDEGRALTSMISFFGLLLIFLLEFVWKGIGKIKLFRKLFVSTSAFWSSKLGGFGEKIIQKMESKGGGVRRSFLIALAFRNMQAKKTRSFVTVGGMGLGIAAIVFLVSVGYGLQRLVVSRVAKLEELKMADITTGQASNIRLDSTGVQTMENIPGVTQIMPIVSLVGKVKYGGGASESVVYGVSGEYLNLVGLNKVKGEYFETKKLSVLPDVRVAGASTEWSFDNAVYGKKIRNTVFNIEPEVALRVRSKPSTSSEIIGYVRRVEGGFEGVEYWGESYPGDDRGREGKADSGIVLGRWIKAPYPLWEKKGLEYVPMYDSERIQDWKEGYIAEIDLSIDEDASTYVQWDDATDRGSVLGDATEASAAATGAVTSAETSPDATISATVVGKDDQGVEWITLGNTASGSGDANTVLMIDAPSDNIGRAVVNQAFVELLGLDINNAVGSSFDIGFVILNTLKPDLDRTAESKPTKYVISAVVEEGTSPIVYVPITDISGLGITNYSQAKLVVEDKNNLDKVRQQIDNLGYKTTSVADTVAQIDKLFGTLRIVLATFGLVALSVASLGMFNTLTVSLMERTREVGIMKAMGMQSFEVKELFLAEAMVMGLLGGIFGVLGGWIAGKLLGVILSVFAIAKGVGWIDVSYIPPSFVIFVLVLSFCVGVVTGIYPARRATKISALDALRYE